MNLIINLFVCIITLIITIVIHRGFLYPITFAYRVMLGIYIGLVIYDPYGKTSSIYLVSLIIFLAGYMLQKLINATMKKKKKYIYNVDKIEKFNEKTDKILEVFSFFIVGFIIYHFLVGGIPIFSSNLEVNRFNFTNSGLFGIPARMYQFGIQFLIIYASVYYEKRKTNKIKRLVIMLWIVMIISRILAGFKSGLVEVATLYFFVSVFINKPINIVHIFFKFKYLIIVLGIIIFAFYTVMNYETMKGLRFEEYIYYFLERLTVIPAIPGWLVLSNSVNYYSENLFIINDILYFISKYTSIGNYKYTLFPLDKIVSSQIYGTTLSHSNFIVPVTVGGFAQLYIDFKLLALVIFFIFGQIYCLMLDKSRDRGKSVLRRSSYGFGIIFLTEFITKGGLGYLIVNYIFLMIIFMIMLITSKQIVKILYK